MSYFKITHFACEIKRWGIFVLHSLFLFFVHDHFPNRHYNKMSKCFWYCCCSGKIVTVQSIFTMPLYLSNLDYINRANRNWMLIKVTKEISLTTKKLEKITHDWNIFWEVRTVVPNRGLILNLGQCFSTDGPRTNFDGTQVLSFY